MDHQQAPENAYGGFDVSASVLSVPEKSDNDNMTVY